MKQAKTHKTILAIALLFMILPALVIHLGLLPPVYLDGVVPQKDELELSWFDGSAQKEFESKLFHNTDFKSLCIRARNEFQYSLFGKINAESAYVFDDYFYRFYVHNYNEDVFRLSQDSITKTLADLVELQKLIGENCPIICIIPPSKSRVFPEYLPERNVTKSKHTNYDRYKIGLAKNNFQVLDFNDYFVKNRDEFDAAVMAKGGVHWTYFAATLAMDSLVKTVSKLKNQSFNQFTYSLSDCGGYNVDDQDLALLLNLIFDRKDPKIKQVNLVQASSLKRKINAVIVGDSFFNVIEKSDLRKLVFTENTDFHYYFQTTIDANLKKTSIDIKKIKMQLKNADCLIFINDVVNFEKFTFGFANILVRELKEK